MAELDPNRNPDTEEQENASSYTPASFEKRTAAWMGVAYMVMLVLVITFAMASGGKGLPGTFPLLLIPVCAAAAVIAVHRRKQGAAPLPLTVLVLLLCAAGVFLGLALGVPALTAALRTLRTPL